MNRKNINRESYRDSTIRENNNKKYFYKSKENYKKTIYDVLTNKENNISENKLNPKERSLLTGTNKKDGLKNLEILLSFMMK